VWAQALWPELTWHPDGLVRERTPYGSD